MAIYDITIKNIDLDLLREQKNILIDLLIREDMTSLDGLINLLDHIQDEAIEQHGLDEEKVFKFENE